MVPYFIYSLLIFFFETGWNDSSNFLTVTATNNVSQKEKQNKTVKMLSKPLSYSFKPFN